MVNIKELMVSSAEFAAGFGVGYFLANKISEKVGPVEIGGVRLHHYLIALGTYLSDDLFIQGVFLGAGMEDLPDLIDDLTDESPQIKRFTNKLRRIQRKELK